ncbi:hypothetical protein [Actinomadura rubrisoli]|uniref:Uncharacterized protein n=1 Tax=Actinomadura rubrisoli TaxID=2530368 RepID=A0A4R5C4T4_9ACTN|nr:hypothetical protein [Actinomadura rubrisoli]TDD94638.1 hypothetical protein E1298_06550 [Actinomadura rubrisoli]
MRSFGARTAACGAAVLLVALLTTRADAARLPLGRTNFAIAVGGLDAGSTANWVRLGQYTFASDGSVSQRHWDWTQRVRVKRASTGVLAHGCAGRDCAVLTADGWQSTFAARKMFGTYRVSGRELRIEWDDGHREGWTLRPLDGGLVGAELADSDFGATHGFGNGSNAPWDARVPADEIAAIDHGRLVHRHHLWKTDFDPGGGYTGYIDEGDGAPFWVTRWKVCAGGRCLGAQTNAEPTVHTVYYVAPADAAAEDRRDTLWHWHTELADALEQGCYTGNSHVKPMIQVVDDHGRFRGWVGVEASLNQTTAAGRNDDDIGVFRILG